MALFDELINPPPPNFLHWLDDGAGWRYGFERQSIDQPAYGFDCVYTFATSYGFIPYIGKAENLHERLSSHERIREAKGKGATELWIHRTSAVSPVHFLEVEKRLIRAYNPPMNSQHNVLSSLGALFGANTGVDASSPFGVGLLSHLKV